MDLFVTIESENAGKLRELKRRSRGSDVASRDAISFRAISSFSYRSFSVVNSSARNFDLFRVSFEHVARTKS